MSKRSWAIYGPIAFAGFVAGGVAAFWATGHLPILAYKSPQALPQSQPHSFPTSGQAERPTSAADDQSKERPEQMALRMDDALTEIDDAAVGRKNDAESLRDNVSRGKKAAKNTGDPKSALESAKPEPLNLRVPEPKAQSLVAADNSPELSQAQQVQEPIDTTKSPAFDLAEKPAPAPQVASYSLFNPEYGLRGFMKQSWVNDTFGVQGGLGLNDGQRIKSENNDLRKDIAVGMGVILAF